jgi:Flp pilus assembly protein TadG
MNRLRNESGQVLVLTVLCMTVLIGFMALALDVGLLFRAKRNVQIAADAAATAAALDYYYSGSKANAIAMGRAAGTSNGITNGDTNGDVVTVNCAPSFGPHTSGSCNGYFEALVTQPNATTLTNIFGISSMNVGSRAVAASVTSVSCIFLMNKTGTDFSLQGAATIENPNGGNTCGIYVNSTDPSSVKVTGQGNSIDAAYVATRGGITGSGQLIDSSNNVVPTSTGAPAENIPPAYQNLSVPAPPTLCPAPTGATKNIQGTVYTYLTNTDVAGMGSSGLCFSGNVLIDGNASTLYLPAGLYTFSGSHPGGTPPSVVIGNNVIGPGIATGPTTGKSTWDPGTGSGAPAQPGITFNIYSGGLSLTSTTNVTLHAPTQDPYNGIVLLAPDVAQDATCNTSPWNIQWGSAQGVFDGMIVAPCVDLTLQDQGGSALVSGLVVGKLTLKTGTLDITKYGANHPTSPLQSIVLVE